MAKIILEFNDEEHEDAKLAMNAFLWKESIREIDNKLREVTKYGNSILKHNQQANYTEITICDKIREVIREILYDNNLKLED